MILALLLTTLLVLGAISTPARPSEEKVRASLPIRTEKNLILLPVSVAGSPPFSVVLDTGMPTRGILLYASERVDALGLAFSDAPAISGAGDPGTSLRTRVAGGTTIDVGGCKIEDVPVISLSAPPGIPKSHEGVIGSELFERFAVRIDRDARRVDLVDREGLKAAKGAVEIPLHFRGGAPFLNARVAMGGAEPLPAALAIDLGASHALWLNSTLEPRFAAPSNSIETPLGHGLSGRVHGRVGRVRRLEIGDVALENVVTVFPKAEHQNPGGFDFRDGFVGGDALRRFRVTFDYAGKRMLLEPGPDLRERFEYDMSGLVLAPADADFRVIDVVLPKSPAAEAGIQPGDRLVAVDGRPIRELGVDGIFRAFRVENAELSLTIDRGSERSQKRIRLRRLV